MNVFKNTRGFTLIELLVVIAIIGVLSAVVIVALNDANNKAQDVSSVTTVQQAHTAFTEQLSNDGTFPAFADLPNYDSATINADLGADRGQYQVATSSTVRSEDFCISYRLIKPDDVTYDYFVADQDGTRHQLSGC